MKVVTTTYAKYTEWVAYHMEPNEHDCMVIPRRYDRPTGEYNIERGYLLVAPMYDLALIGDNQ